MPSITFGFAATFKHRGEQSEIKTRNCPMDNSHVITNGYYCPECGSHVVETTEKHIVYNKNEIEHLIKQIWGDIDQKYREELFYHCHFNNFTQSSTVLCRLTSLTQNHMKEPVLACRFPKLMQRCLEEKFGLKVNPVKDLVFTLQ